MYLHENKELFKEILERTADSFAFPEDIIEKDYYVFLILRQIKKLCPLVIFKGGTSLSKAFNVINRFSEDIDLTFSSFIKKEKRSKLIKHNTIMEASKILSFPILNINNTQGDWEVCHYDFMTPAIADYSVSGMDSKITIETSYLSPCENPEQKTISSFIYQFLNKNYPKLLEQYDLEPFIMNVQPLEITFIDKVYALCDYYLEEKIEKHSRHLYDLYKMAPLISFDEDFKILVQSVRKHRETLNKAYSVKQKKSISSLVDEIIAKETYKQDYLNKTMQLIKEKDISYNDVIIKFKEIVDTNYF